MKGSRSNNWGNIRIGFCFCCGLEFFNNLQRIYQQLPVRRSGTGFDGRHTSVAHCWQLTFYSGVYCMRLFYHASKTLITLYMVMIGTSMITLSELLWSTCRPRTCCSRAAIWALSKMSTNTKAEKWIVGKDLFQCLVFCLTLFMWQTFFPSN